MVDISGLNPQQHEAASTICGPVMILAGAGTGKTRVITYRIGHMLASGLLAEQMVALTFTNKAAREMKERVQGLVGRSAKGLRIGTFHSFCIHLLRRFAESAGLERNFTLTGTGDQLDLIRRALEEKGWHGLYNPEQLLSRISRAKNELLRPQEVCTSPKMQQLDDDPELLSKVYELYERQLRLHRVIDFDDCILKVAHMLDEQPDVLKQLQDELTHFMVDEFQDTNFSQLSVLERLAAKNRNICVVGDDDQSIYSWRGAMVETIDRFEAIFPGTKLIKLEQNYRCTNVILNAANQVIKNNVGRKEKTLWSQNESEHYISLVSQVDDVSEAKFIAEKCFGLLGQGFKPKDIGILYRANSQARAIEAAMREFHLQYKVYGGSSFFERKEVKDFLAYFKLTVDPNDRMSFWRIINTPSRGVGIKTMERIDQIAKKHQLSPFQVIEQDLVEELNVKQKTALKELIETIKQHHKHGLINIDELEERGRSLIRSFGLEQDIRAKVSHEGSRQRKLESLRRLPTWLKRMGEFQVEDKGSLNLTDLLDYLMLSDDASKQEEKGNDNHISLMTIHASKGLEFPIVFVCGLEEDLLPHKNSVGSQLGLSEERRLFYVAITRAKEKLFLSFARERYQQFQKISKRPSRFLKELPEQGIVVEDTAAQLLSAANSASVRRERNLQRFADLRSKLKGGFQST